MGFHLVAAAFAFSRSRPPGEELEPLALALLVWMAHNARDDDESPVYYAGREVSLEALGLPRTDAGRLRLKRATASLARSGAIVRHGGTGHRGVVSRYGLRLWGSPMTLKGGERVSQVIPKEADWGSRATPNPAERGSQVTRKGVAGDPPNKRPTRGRARTGAPALARVLDIGSGRTLCADDRHRPLPDGSCARCSIHPDDLRKVTA